LTGSENEDSDGSAGLPDGTAVFVREREGKGFKSGNGGAGVITQSSIKNGLIVYSIKFNGTPRSEHGVDAKYVSVPDYSGSRKRTRSKRGFYSDRPDSMTNVSQGKRKTLPHSASRRKVKDVHPSERRETTPRKSKVTTKPS